MNKTSEDNQSVDFLSKFDQQIKLKNIVYLESRCVKMYNAMVSF